MQQKLHKNNNTILQITTTLPFFFFSSLSFMWVLCKLQWVVLGALLDMGFDYLKSVSYVLMLKDVQGVSVHLRMMFTYQIHYRHVFLLPLLWTYYYHIYIYICAYIRWRFSFSRHSHVDMTSMVLEIQSGIESHTQVMCGHA